MASRADVIVRFGGDKTAVDKTLGQIRGSVKGLGGELKNALGMVGLGFSGAMVVQAFVNANAAAQSYTLALQSVLGSTDAVASAMDFINGLADRLGMSVAVLADQFVTLSASTKGTALEGQATRDAFEAVASAMAKLGRSSEEAKRALVAIGQMATKGKVLAEELTGQLGEALPGAVEAMARGLGMTKRELLDFSAAGKLVASEGIPALTKGLTDLFSISQSDRVDTLTASINRFWNELNRAYVIIGEGGGSKFLSNIIETGTLALEMFNQAMGETTDQLSRFPQLLDITQRIVEQKAQMAKDDGWILSVVFTKQLEEIKRMQEIKLRELEEERDKIIAELAAGRSKVREGSPDFVGPPKPLAEKQSVDGGISLEGAKKIEEAMKAREAAKDAARLKDMTAAQRQWELESRIMRALNEEKAAIAKGDEERAKKAQAIQEETLRKLIADPITPDYIVEKYRKMVTAIEAAPGPEVKIKINWEDFLGLPAKLQAAIQSPGSGYTIDMTVRVHPVLIKDGNQDINLLQDQADPGTQAPLTDLIKQANDAVGANP